MMTQENRWVEFKVQYLTRVRSGTSAMLAKVKRLCHVQKVFKKANLSEQRRVEIFKY